MKTKRTVLALACGMAMGSAWAFEAIDDEELSGFTAREGLMVNATATSIPISRLYWADDGNELQFRGISINNLNATFNMDVGSSSLLASATPALAISSTLKPFNLTVASFGLCDAGVACATTFGELAFVTTNDSTFSYFNTNGLFDGGNSSGRLRINIKDANFYLAQTYSGTRGVAILKNLNLNAVINGKFRVGGLNSLGGEEGLWIDNATLGLSKVGSTNGFQFDLAHNTGTAVDTAGEFSTTGAKSIVRVGASGNITNLTFKVKGDNTLAGGSGSGIKVSTNGTLDKNTFSLELGHENGYSVTFRNFVDLAQGGAINPPSPVLNLGDWYFNIIAGGSTLADIRTGFGSVGGVGLTDSLGIAIRDMNVQAYARILEFQNNATPTIKTAQNWSLIPTLYDLDANMLLFPDGYPTFAAGTKRGIGFDLKMAMTGRNGSGTQGTHLLIADPTANTYLGWRNIDAKIALGQSQFFVANSATDGVDGIMMTSNAFSANLVGEFAVGYLPNGGTVTSILDNDEMFGLRVNLAGQLSLALSPPGGTGGYLGLSGQLVLNGTDNNQIVIIEPTDNTELQFSNISGTLNMLPQHVTDADYSDASRIEIGNSTVTFAAALEFGPGSTVFRVGDVNLGIDNDTIAGNPLLAANVKRLGEIVIPGGRLYAQIDIKPQ